MDHHPKPIRAMANVVEISRDTLLNLSRHRKTETPFPRMNPQRMKQSKVPVNDVATGWEIPWPLVGKQTAQGFTHMSPGKPNPQRSPAEITDATASYQPLHINGHIKGFPFQGARKTYPVAPASRSP
jgi:hypothetical protein